VEFKSPHLHHQGLVTDQALCLVEGALRVPPSAYLWTGVQRSLIVNSVGGSQAALSCTADVATGVHGLPGRVFQARDPALAMPPFIVGDRLG
jgi:hypothetical protein